MDNDKQDKIPEVFDAEFTEKEKYVDHITPQIQQHTQLVEDRKGNKLLWMAILAGCISLIMFLLSVFSMW